MADETNHKTYALDKNVLILAVPYYGIKTESGKPFVRYEHFKMDHVRELKGKYPRSSDWFISVGEMGTWVSLSDQAKEHLEFLIGDGINTDRLLEYVQSETRGGFEAKIACCYNLRKDPITYIGSLARSVPVDTNTWNYIFETINSRDNTKTE